MEELARDHPKSISDYPDKESKPEKFQPQKSINDPKKQCLAIIEEYMRKNGVSLSEQMWAQLEKAVDTNWKW